MRYRISVAIEYKIAKIAKSACKAAGAMHNGGKNCMHVHSIRQLTIHADVHESKCGYSLPLLHSPIYYLVKEDWYHIFIFWVIKIWPCNAVGLSVTDFWQLSTKLQALKKKLLKLQRCWGNAQFKAAHNTESDVHYCMKANISGKVFLSVVLPCRIVLFTTTNEGWYNIFIIWFM